jgi:hypothetical protein
VKKSLKASTHHHDIDEQMMVDSGHYSDRLGAKKPLKGKGVTGYVDLRLGNGIIHIRLTIVT